MKDVARALAEQTGLSQAKAREFLDKALDDITQALLTKGRIRLGTFGIFEVRMRKARTARNPRTGEKIPIPPRAILAFKPSSEMRERIAQLKELPSQVPAAPPDTSAAPPANPT